MEVQVRYFSAQCLGRRTTCTTWRTPYSVLRTETVERGKEAEAEGRGHRPASLDDPTPLAQLSHLSHARLELSWSLVIFRQGIIPAQIQTEARAGSTVLSLRRPLTLSNPHARSLGTEQTGGVEDMRLLLPLPCCCLAAASRCLLLPAFPLGGALSAHQRREGANPLTTLFVHLPLWAFRFDSKYCSLIKRTPYVQYLYVYRPAFHR
jgi:hypothetical protein